MDNIYSIYDKKMATYMPPVTSPNIAVMTRDLTEVINTNNVVKFAKYPADHDLYLLGTYDSITASFILLDAPDFIINLNELKGAENATS